MNPVTIKTARCLILWPDHTHGYHQEEAALRILIGLADLIGYGRLPQLAAQLEKLWRDPSLAPAFEQQRQSFLDFQRTCLHPSHPSHPSDIPTDNNPLSDTN
jgi:hypothetical protein